MYVGIGYQNLEDDPFNLWLLSNHDLFTLGFLRTRQVLTLRTERVIIHVAAGPYMCKQVIIHFSNEIMLRKCTPLGSPRSNLFGYIRQQF